MKIVWQDPEKSGDKLIITDKNRNVLYRAECHIPSKLFKGIDQDIVADFPNWPESITDKDMVIKMDSGTLYISFD